jgi:hypothetical protein
MTEVVLDLIRLFILIAVLSILVELAFQVGQWIDRRKNKP